MGKRRRIVLAVFVVFVLGGIVWLCLRPPEPVYAGKPLHYWIELLESTSPGFDPPPLWNELGQDEFPVLIKALRLRDSRSHNVFFKAYARVRLSPKLPIFLRRHLPQVLDTETLAINALLELNGMAETDRRPPVGTRLAIPVLIRLMKTDKTEPIRMMAASELGWLANSTKNKEVVTALTEALHDTSPSVRQWAADSIGRVDPRKPPKRQDKLNNARP
jgi:hypothetical protein